LCVSFVSSTGLKFEPAEAGREPDLAGKTVAFVGSGMLQQARLAFGWL